MPCARIRDIDVYLEIHGAGPRVLLISGTGADLRTDPNRDRHPLTTQYEVLMFDQRGLGQTSKPNRSYTMADDADDAAGPLDAPH